MRTEALNAQLVIACKLKAPKGQYNSFGKYHYRSREDILEAVKPLLREQDCALLETDEIVMVGERYYVKATATLVELASGDSVSTCGWAREDKDKKGMDGSQITGTASSYARKYALNALFLIDDTKDADTDEHHRQTKEPSFMDMFREVAKAHNVPEHELQVMVKQKLGLDVAKKIPQSRIADAKELVKLMQAAGTLDVTLE